jgi:hypothetical protein
LRAHETSVQVEDQVVALVHAKRQWDRIPTPNQLRQDRGLGSLTDIDGVIRQLRFRQS